MLQSQNLSNISGHAVPYHYPQRNGQSTLSLGNGLSQMSYEDSGIRSRNNGSMSITKQ